jgi:hypothetical protein
MAKIRHTSRSWIFFAADLQAICSICSVIPMAPSLRLFSRITSMGCSHLVAFHALERSGGSLVVCERAKTKQEEA